MIQPSVWVRSISARSSQAMTSLTLADQKILQNISHPNRQNSFITGRQLLHDALAKQGINYQNYQIKYHKLGKPYANPSDFQFNITHSGQLLFLILSDANNACGIDCEQLKPRSYQKIIHEYFKPQEINYILEKESLKRFYQLWTIKESLIKQSSASVFSQKNLPIIDINQQKIITPNNQKNIQTFEYKDFIFSISTQKKESFHFYNYCQKTRKTLLFKPKPLLSSG